MIEAHHLQAEELLLEQLATLAAPQKCRRGAADLSANPQPLTSSSGRLGNWDPQSGYRALIENLPVVTFIAALDDTLQDLYVSPQIEAMLGFTQEEWCDDPFLWFRQLHPDDRDQWIEAFAKTCSEGADFSDDYRLIARDGHVVWVHGECQLVRNADGIPIFIQGIATDITDRKAAEAAAAEAQRAAEAASRVKSEFIAHMSHEIRTPLNGLLGMIDLTLATSLDSRQRRHLDIAKQAGEALSILVGDILDFSKVEAGKLEIESAPFDLHALAAQVQQIQSVRASQKGLQLDVQVGAEIPAQLLGDPARIRQILINLTNNAVKFTEKGAIQIVVTVQSPTDESMTLHFSVTDTGIGIPAEGMDRLFKSFSQVDASTTRQYGGTGLGLVISKRLAELMGGTIGVESMPGRGSTFWFTAKVGRSALVASKSPALPGASPSLTDQTKPPQERVRSARILLAEDNTVNQIVVSTMLANMGHACKIAHDGRQAVEAVLRDSYDLVLMDCQMPVMNGLDATRAIRRNESAGLSGSGRRVPIIALTANATSEDRDACLAAGMDAFCTKPVSSQKLMEVMESVRAKSNERSDAASPAPVRVAKPSLAPSAPFDIELLIETCAGDVAVISKTLDSFEDQVSANLSEIERSIREANARDVAKVAHDLKGVAGIFVATEMARIAKDLETSAKSNDLIAAAEALRQLRWEVEQCLKYLPAARTQIAMAVPAIDPIQLGSDRR